MLPLTRLFNPILQMYNTGLFGMVLNAIHNIWWMQARRREWERAPNKISFCAQILLNGVALQTSAGRLYFSSIFYIVKLDDINNAYTRRREAQRMILRVWNGEFDIEKRNFISRLVFTAWKILLYIKEVFCFFMVCVDAAKSLEFNEQAQLEAVSNVIHNSARVGKLFFSRKAADTLKQKLRLNIKLIQTGFHCDEFTALRRIDKIYRILIRTQNNPIITSAIAGKNMINNVLAEAEEKHGVTKFIDGITEFFSVANVFDAADND